MWVSLSSESILWLHSVSVVIIARFHNPSILNRDFLARTGIVDSKWKDTDAVSTPALSFIKYENGVQWKVDPQRLEISIEYNTRFVDEDEKEIHDLAVSYVRKLPHVPYQAIGLNCLLSIENEKPLQWMTQNFLKPRFRQGVKMIPRFVIETEEGLLNLSFGERSVRRSDKEGSAVFIDCNLHHDGPFDTIESMVHVLTGWERARDLITLKLNDILGDK